MGKLQRPPALRSTEGRQDRDARLAIVNRQWRSVKPLLTEEAQKWGDILQVIQNDGRCGNDECRIALNKSIEILRALRNAYDKSRRKHLHREHPLNWESHVETGESVLCDAIALLEQRIQSVEAAN